MPKIKVENLRSVTRNILLSVGVPVQEADIITDSVLYAHCREKHTHGIGRLSIYVRKIQEHLMAANTEMVTLNESASFALLDANNGFGQVAGYRAMEKCIEKAKECGVGLVGVRNSNNFGTAGFLTEYATQKGMIGIALSNSAPAIAPTGGSRAVLGTNPLSIAFPCNGELPSIVLDMATSMAARGKIRLAAKNGESIPLGWALDVNGNPTDDPVEALKGSLIPIGDYKGYGLSLAIDVLAGLLTGAAFGGDVKPLNDPTGTSGYGHLFIAIDIGRFMTMDDYEKKINVLVSNIKKCGDPDKVLMPGERSYQMSMKNGIDVSLSQKQVEEVNALASQLGVTDSLIYTN